MNVGFVKAWGKSAQRAVRVAGSHIRTASPEILLVAGVVGVIASTVMACVATKKAVDIISDHNINRDRMKDDYVTVDEDGNPIDDENKELDEVSRTDIWKLYGRTGMLLVKTYAIPVALGTASIICIFSSHGIMRRRNAGLLVAYSALEKGFDEYRNKVRDLIGEEQEREIAYGIVNGETRHTYIGDDGNEVTVVNNGPISNGLLSPYARYFDAYAIYGWKGDVAEDTALDGAIGYANQRLYAKDGQVITLNEILRDIGYSEDTSGASAGWAVGITDDIEITKYKCFRQIEENGMTTTIPTTIIDFNCIPDIKMYIDRSEDLCKQKVCLT